MRGREAWEVAFHFEARDKQLNRYLLLGFRRHLFEIKDTLGASVEAEMWDRGWAKVYDVVPQERLTAAHQTAVATRLAELICCLQPIFVELRDDVRRLHR